MSKHTRVATQIRDLDALERALKSLGIRYQRGEHLAWSTYGQHGANAVFVIDRETNWEAYNQRYRVNGYGQMAVIQNDDGSYSMVYDTHYGQEDNAAAQIIKQQYALEVVSAGLAAYGLSASEVEMQKDGSIRVLATSYGPAGETKVEARITREGMVDASAGGFQGEACSPVVQKVQQALGGQIISETPNDDYYAPPSDPGVFRDISDYH